MITFFDIKTYRNIYNIKILDINAKILYLYDEIFNYLFVFQLTL